MGRLSALLIASASLLLPACAFLLNFDELQEGDPDAGPSGGDSAASGGAGGTGGDSGTGGGGTTGSGGSSGSSGGSGGSGGTPTCPTDCSDPDPCTRDFCDDTVTPPVCKHEPQTGLFDDGFKATISGEAIHRVTTTTAGNAFYFSVFQTIAARNEITLYRVSDDKAEFEELLKVTGIGAFNLLEARSAAGMVADTSAGLKLHAFVAFDAGSGNTAVWHVVLDGTFNVNTAQATQLTATYDHTGTDGPRRYPKAFDLGGGNIWGSWINKDGTISFGAAGKTQSTIGSTTIKAGQYSLIASPTGPTPGAIWTTGLNGVFMQIAGGLASQLTECETRAGVYSDAASAQILSGFWLTSWTKGNIGFLGTEGRGIGCSGTMCLSDTACDADSVDASVRNPATTTARKPGDPPGTIYLASAAALLGPNAQGDAEAALILSANRLDFGATPFQSPPTGEQIGQIVLDQMKPKGVLNDGPNFPAISLSATDRIAVAWIRPKDVGQGSELRIERRRVCLTEN
jgi:hypothetical protein